MLTLGLAGFSLVFLPLYFFEKSKEKGTDGIMDAAGAAGLALFALGTLFKLMQWPGAAVLLTLGGASLFMVCFPKYIMNRSLDSETKHRYLRSSFFVIVIGALLALYFIKSIEIHDARAQVSGVVAVQ